MNELRELVVLRQGNARLGLGVAGIWGCPVPGDGKVLQLSTSRLFPPTQHPAPQAFSFPERGRACPLCTLPGCSRGG